MTGKGLSIIIPAHNEDRRIGKTLADYLDFFAKSDFEIIVILDGCSDGTLSIVKSFSGSEKLRFRDFSRRLGKGGAVLEGFKLAAKDHIGYVDSDNSTKAADFNDLFGKIGDRDGVIASRYLEGSEVLGEQPVARTVASRSFNLLVRVLFDLPFTDTQCGAKIFRRETINKILPLVATTDWAFDIDILLAARSSGLKIAEVPTKWSYAKGSTLDLRRTVPAMLFSVAKLRLRNSKPVRIAAAPNTPPARPAQ